MATIRFLAWIMFAFFIIVRSSDKFCKNAYFHRGSEMPYVQLEGVYQLNDNKIKIYKHEQRGFLFEYNNVTNSTNFSQELNGTRSYMGVKAEMTASYKHRDQFPSYNFTRRWWYYNGDTHVAVRKSATYFECVDDVHKCSTGRMSFNSTLTLNGAALLKDTDYFDVLPDTFMNNRRVYKHNKNGWFLYFDSSRHWVVGSNYNSSSLSGIYMKVNDSPINPEYISQNWSLLIKGTTWTDSSNPVRLECRGINKGCKENKRCRANLCGGRIKKCTCNFLNETVCLCPDHLHGLNCSKPVQNCPTYSPGSNVKYYYSHGSKVGDLVTVFCNKGYSPDFYLQQCRTSKNTAFWSSHNCTKILTPATTLPATTLPATTLPVTTLSATRLNPTSSIGNGVSHPFSFDQYSWVFIVLFFGFPVLPILGTIIIDVIRERVITLKVVFRVSSIFTFLGVLFWFMISQLCDDSCQKHGPKTYEQGKIMTLALIGVAYLFQLLDSFYSLTRERISKISKHQSATGYIEGLEQSTPKRYMKVECWHMETKTTDNENNKQATTNNKQTTNPKPSNNAAEAHQEKVITHTEEQEFPISYSQDVSPCVRGTLRKYTVTCLSLSQCVTFGDEETREKFYDMKNNMLIGNEDKDTEITFSHRDIIPGFQTELSAYTYERAKPFWMNLWCFWLAGALFLSWPFRFIARMTIRKVDYTVRKEIFLRRPEREIGPNSALLDDSTNGGPDDTGLVSTVHANDAAVTGAMPEASRNSSLLDDVQDELQDRSGSVNRVRVNPSPSVGPVVSGADSRDILHNINGNKSPTTTCLIET